MSLGQASEALGLLLQGAEATRTDVACPPPTIPQAALPSPAPIAGTEVGVFPLSVYAIVYII